MASYLGLVDVDMSFKMGKRLAESAYGDCYAIANLPHNERLYTCARTKIFPVGPITPVKPACILTLSAHPSYIETITLRLIDDSRHVDMYPGTCH